MTCIVGCVDKRGRVLLGADSVVVFGDVQITCADPKVRAIGPIVYGAAGSGRACGLAMSAPELPEWQGSDPYAWMTDVFVPAIRERMGGGESEDSDSDDDSTTLLVGLDGRLYFVDTAWGVFQSGHPYAAIGSATSVALGAMAVSGHLGAKSRLRGALRAAARHCVGIGPPWRWARTE